MAKKTPKQQAAQAAVEARLTSDGPVRLDASAVQSGGERGSTKQLSGIHPSLEGATETMREAGIQGGQITTPSGLSVRVARPKPDPQGAYRAQGPALGNPTAAAPQEGVSMRFSQQIGRDHGADVAQSLHEEADAIAAQPNPLRSDGHVDMLVALHSPSMGGNTFGHQGKYSRVSKRGTANRTPESAQVAAQRALGYTDEVQSQMVATARDRITRRQGRGHAPALTDAEIASRAYGQVNEHLDEAIHGTKEGTHSDRTGNVISDLAEQHEEGTQGFSVKRDSPEEGAGTPVRRGPAPTGPGMSKSRTPIQRAQRQAVRTLTRQKGGWAALQDADAHTQAASNDLKVLDLRQKARRASEVAPEDRQTDSKGAQPEQRARALAQPVFSTGTHPESGATSALPTGVGVPSEQAAAMGRRAAKVRKGQTTTRSSAVAKVRSPGRAASGEISPIPTSLPTEPARLGRTREERGVGQVRSPTGGLVPAPKNYGGAIAGYAASRPAVTPKTGSGSSSASAVPATESNVEVAQTKTTPAAKPKAANTGMGTARPKVTKTMTAAEYDAKFGRA